MGRTKSGIVVEDRWRDNALSTSEKLFLIPAGDRCPKESRYLIRVWDPRAPAKLTRGGTMGRPGRYRNECFATVTEGQRWATQEKGEFIKGTSSALTTTIASLGVAFLESLRTRIDGSVTERHLAQVGQVIDGMVTAGARDITDPTFPDVVQRWLSKLPAQRHWQKNPRPASPSLRRKFLVIARSVMAYAQERRLVAYDPLVAVKVGRVEVKRRGVFTIADLGALVGDASRWSDKGKRQETHRALEAAGGNQLAAAKALGIAPSTMSYRLNSEAEADPWWMVAVLLTYTGVRLSEAISMTPRMVNLEAGTLLLPAAAAGNKMKRDRRIRLQPELHAILADLLGGKSISLDAPLVGEHMAAYSPTNLSNGFKDYCRRCGITPGARGPHALRHTFCALMTALGASPFLVMDMAGHTSAQVAKGYSASAEELVDQVSEWQRHEPPQFYLRRNTQTTAPREIRK